MASHDSIEGKMKTAREKKDIGDQAFKGGKIVEALRSYHEALLYLIGLDKSALKDLGLVAPTPESKKPESENQGQDIKTEADELTEKIYANMSACHLKNNNWQRALETANKALAKNEHNYKAMYRKGKALGELGYYERAVQILEQLKKESPNDAPSTESELSRLKAQDKARERKVNQKLKGFLANKTLSDADNSATETSEWKSGIEEVKE